MQDTEPNTSILCPIPLSPKASGYIRYDSLNGENMGATSGEPVATGSAVHENAHPAVEPQHQPPRPRLSFPFKPVSPLTKEEEMRRYPWYIPPRSSELDIQMNWPPDPDAPAGEGSSSNSGSGQEGKGKGKGKGRAAGDEGEDDDEDNSGVVPVKTKGEESPWRDVNMSVEIVESASGAIGRVKRAAAKAKAKKEKASRSPEATKRKWQDEEPIARLKDPNFMPYGGIDS